MTAVANGSAADRARAPRVVIVTGVSRFLGATVAARIAADPRVRKVVGVDRVDPPAELAQATQRSFEARRVGVRPERGVTVELD